MRLESRYINSMNSNLKSKRAIGIKEPIRARASETGRRKVEAREGAQELKLGYYIILYSRPASRV